MDVQVLDFDLAAAVAEFAGQELRESARAMPASRSLAYCELLLPLSVIASESEV
jgi:hypothetical protein